MGSRNEFWMANILSMDKLREQFDKLELQRNNDLKRRNGQNGHRMANLNFAGIDLTPPQANPGAQEVLRQADEQEAEARGRS